MAGYKDLLRADPTEWLLEWENPSVRYFALKELMDYQEEEEEVRAARQAVMETGIVPKMLALQRDPAYINTYPSFYTAKYRGLSWSLIVYAELGALPIDEIKMQCEYIFKHSREITEGGFSQHEAVKTGGGRLSEVIPCLTGNLVWSLNRLGYLHDPRLQKSIDWLVKYMRFNDGEEINPQVPPYSKYEMCWGRHTCHMAVVKALKAMSEIPSENRTAEIEAMIRAGVEFMLVHHVYKRSHNLKRTSKPGWLKFGFPLMYQTDVLEILDILTALGAKDKRMEEAIQAVLLRQDDSGCWQIENTYNSDRLLVPFGKACDKSKWLTLRAMRVLKRYMGG